LIRLLATRSYESSFRGLYRLGFASYIARVRALLCGARTRVAIITPFLDNDGARFLKEAWEGRTTEAVQWYLYTREIGPTVRSVVLARPWKIYEYSSGRDRGDMYGTHAKVTIIDNQVATVGSMNLTQASMYSTLEVGIETDDSYSLRRLCKLELMLRAASRRVAP
jgi:phosphatidylserine/phosphatidylglycerophosphate/cardiolipin synthase-like enzyme